MMVVACLIKLRLIPVQFHTMVHQSIDLLMPDEMLPSISHIVLPEKRVLEKGSEEINEHTLTQRMIVSFIPSIEGMSKRMAYFFEEM